jgi:hypothetical protein
MPSPILNIADIERPESLQKNLYKIDSAYDLTSDAVTQSLNALQTLTGYDYRTNDTLDIIERLVDVSADSKIVTIGARRLVTEFNRRALTRNFDDLIPTPTDLTPNFRKFFKNTEYKRADSYITDPLKDPNKSVANKLLQNTIGYIDNESYLKGLYKKLDKNIISIQDYESNINYLYSGDMIKEKILQLNDNSVFSTYNVKNTSKIDFENKSLVFFNTYDRDFIDNSDPDYSQGLYEINAIYGIYTKSYFKNYPLQINSLTKNYLLELKDLEVAQGFGNLSTELDYIATLNRANSSIALRKETTNPSVTNRDSYLNEGNVYHYDSKSASTINTKFGVKRGLVYFTSRLAQNEDLAIAQNTKELYANSKQFYKGNGECRTFTIYDQYDNYNKVIKFDGNGETHSVLKDTILPKVAPNDSGADKEEKRNFFFTMENLATGGNAEDCDIGPNGGKWMWFVPYNVKISDNNQVNWSEINFLGRPEPIYSYQNTTRNLSLSFSLLIDTVSDIQNIAPTIQNYYNYIYACNQVVPQSVTFTTQPPIVINPNALAQAFNNSAAITSNNKPKKIKNQPKNFNFSGITEKDIFYYFKPFRMDGDKRIQGLIYNDSPVYTTIDNKLDATGDTEFTNIELSGLTYNQRFTDDSANVISATSIQKIFAETLDELLRTSTEINMTISCTQGDENFTNDECDKFANNRNDNGYTNKQIAYIHAIRFIESLLTDNNDNPNATNDTKKLYDELQFFDSFLPVVGLTAPLKINDFLDELESNQNYLLRIGLDKSYEFESNFTHSSRQGTNSFCKVSIKIETKKVEKDTIFESIVSDEIMVRRHDIKYAKKRKASLVDFTYIEDPFVLPSSLLTSQLITPITTTININPAPSNPTLPASGADCDPILSLKFDKLKKNHKFPIGYEKLKVFTPSFNSQTPFDFTKRYVFLHQLTRPSKLGDNSKVNNIVFGKMPVFILRYGDFLHTKAIARSINFDISEATWDLNPEGMGVIPLYCNITMDLTLLGGQSLKGPIDRIQTANDSAFIANTSFNSGRYKDNKRFTSVRDAQTDQY